MCNRCAILLTENARLRDLLEVRTRADLIGRIQTYFGVTPGQARLLLRLYQDRGGVVSHADLYKAVPVRYLSHLGDRRNKDYLHVMFSQMRRYIGAGVIQNARGYGYRLTSEGVDLLRRALAGDFMREAA